MERLTRKDGNGNWYVGDEPGYDSWAVPKKFYGDAIDRLAHYEDLEEQGRLHISKAYSCPKCGKHELTPRIDGEFYYCFGCKTQFSKDEAEAALRQWM